MSFMTCCVQDCLVRYPEGGVLHRFPNPKTDHERFNDWVNRVGGELCTLDHEYIYKNKRICDKHFETKYYGSKNRLIRTAVPTLHLSYMVLYVPIPKASQSISSPQPVEAVPSTSKVEDKPLPAVVPSKSLGMTTDLAVTDGSLRPNIWPAEIGPSTMTIAVTPSKPTGKGTVMAHQEKHLKKVVTDLKREVRRNRMTAASYKRRLKLAQRTAKHKVMKQIEKKMTKAARTFINMQIREAGKNAKGRRFTLKEKILALALYKPSPKAYRLLSNICVLPQKKTLNQLLQKIPLKPGINKFLFADLKEKVAKLPAQHRFCTVIFDEMSIAPYVAYDRRVDEIVGFTDNGVTKGIEFCDHALVFMVRGVIKKFKQPTSYVFCNSNMKSCDLAHEIRKLIIAVQDTGLKVVATVCDQSAKNIAAINLLINNTKAEYLRKEKEWQDNIFEINSKKIVPIFDPPHLLKGIRNNLLTKDLKFIVKGKEQVAKWQHIVDLYKRSPGYSGVRLVPKLTMHHVFPELIPKMKVKMCSQVFSRSVGVALGFMADVGKLPEDSKGTADLLLLFDDLFDSVNGSSSRIENGKYLRTAVTPTSPHHKLWQDILPVIKTMEYCNNKGKTSRVTSITSWVKTIEGFKIILKDFYKLGITSVLLRNFNQDPIENFFGAIRSHGSQNIMPHAAAFQASYKSLMINNMTSTHSVGANCEKDNNTCLLNSLEHFFNCQSDYSDMLVTEEDSVSEEHLNIEAININNLIQNENEFEKERCAALVYCSGWLLTKARNIYKDCDICKKDLESSNTEDYHRFIKLSEYSNKDWLCYPTKESFDLFTQIENIVYTVLKKCSNKKNLLQYVKLICFINLDTSFIKCQIHSEILKEFLINKSAIFHIFTWCKNINKILMGKEYNYNKNDDMQMAAYQYKEKNKTKKRIRKTGREISL